MHSFKGNLPIFFMGKEDVKVVEVVEEVKEVEEDETKSSNNL